MTVRVVIADDHAVVRRGTREILESHPDLAVVGEAGDGEEAVLRAGDLTPDVVVLDLQMPGIDGLEATRRIVAARPGSVVIILSVHDEDAYVHEAIRAGARGYLLKHVRDEELIDAVLRAARGEPVIDRSLTSGLLAAVIHDEEEPPLTGRQLEVLRLVAGGASNRAIGRALDISERTVEVHLSNVYRSLGVSSRTEAVTVALRRGIIALEPDG